MYKVILIVKHVHTRPMSTFWPKSKPSLCWLLAQEQTRSVSIFWLKYKPGPYRPFGPSTNPGYVDFWPKCKPGPMSTFWLKSKSDLCRPFDSSINHTQIWNVHLFYIYLSNNSYWSFQNDEYYLGLCKKWIFIKELLDFISMDSVTTIFHFLHFFRLAFKMFYSKRTLLFTKFLWSRSLCNSCCKYSIIYFNRNLLKSEKTNVSCNQSLQAFDFWGWGQICRYGCRCGQGTPTVGSEKNTYPFLSSPTLRCCMNHLPSKLLDTLDIY